MHCVKHMFYLVSIDRVEVVAAHADTQPVGALPVKIGLNLTRCSCYYSILACRAISLKVKTIFVMDFGENMK